MKNPFQPVELVGQILAARKQLAAAQSDKDQDLYTNRCDGLDRQIWTPPVSRPFCRGMIWLAPGSGLSDSFYSHDI